MDFGPVSLLYKRIMYIGHYKLNNTTNYSEFSCQQKVLHSNFFKNFYSLRTKFNKVIYGSPRKVFKYSPRVTPSDLSTIITQVSLFEIQSGFFFLIMLNSMFVIDKYQNKLTCS